MLQKGGIATEFKIHILTGQNKNDPIEPRLPNDENEGVSQRMLGMYTLRDLFIKDIRSLGS
jgi:hypothetical protein